jgi:hypothetical protein
LKQQLGIEIETEIMRIAGVAEKTMLNEHEKKKGLE